MPVGTLIGVGTQLAGTIAGLLGSKRANKRADKKFNSLIQDRERSINQMFDSEYSKDFLDTEVAKNAVRDINDRYSKNQARAEGKAAVAGATDEAQIAAQTQGNEQYNAALSQLTGMGTRYRDSLRQDYQRQLEQMFGMKMANENRIANRESDTWANVIGNSAGIGSSIGNLVGMFGKDQES